MHPRDTLPGIVRHRKTLGLRLTSGAGTTRLGQLLLYFVRRPMCKARLRVGTDIGVGPTVKRTLLDASEVIGRKIVAKSVTLLNSCVEFSSSRVECEGRRIANSRGKRGVAGAVRFAPLTLGLHLGLHAEVAGGADPYKQGSRFWIYCEVTVLVTRNYPKHASLRDQFLAVCRRHGLALFWGNVRDLWLIGAAATNGAADMRHAPDALFSSSLARNPDRPKEVPMSWALLVAQG